MKTRRLVLLSMLIAINVVLSIVPPIDLKNFRFTFEAFPILFAAITFGPIDGLIVGGLGSAIYQLFFTKYGITLTTPLWIIPHAISGYVVGLYSKKHGYNLTQNQAISITIASSLLVTLLNTAVIYIDAKIYGYYSFAYVFGLIIFKIIAGVMLAIIYSITIPKILKRFKI